MRCFFLRLFFHRADLRRRTAGTASASDVYRRLLALIVEMNVSIVRIKRVLIAFGSAPVGWIVIPAVPQRTPQSLTNPA